MPVPRYVIDQLRIYVRSVPIELMLQPLSALQGMSASDAIATGRITWDKILHEFDLAFGRRGYNSSTPLRFRRLAVR